MNQIIGPELSNPDPFYESLLTRVLSGTAHGANHLWRFAVEELKPALGSVCESKQDTKKPRRCLRLKNGACLRGSPELQMAATFL